MAEEMTLEQQQALAMASARLRLQQQQQTPSEIPAPRRSWSDVPSEAVTNLPSSAMKFAGGLYEAVTSPVQTAKGLLDLGAGALQNIVPKPVKDFIDQFDANPEAAKRAVSVANAVGGEYAKRYGSVEGLKDAIATDPVGVASDLSTLLSGGAAIAGKSAPAVSKALQTAATYTNPMSLVAKPIEYGLGMTAKAAGNVVDFMQGERSAVRAGNIIRNALTEEGRTPQNILAARAALQNAPEGATVRQALSDVVSPQIQYLGQLVEARAPGAAMVTKQAQEAGRLEKLQGVMPAPDVAAAEAIRKNTATRLYGISDEAMLPGRERQFKAVQTGETPSGTPRIDPITGQARTVEVGRDTLTNAPILAPDVSVGGAPIYKHVLAGYKYDPQLANLMGRPAIQAAFDSATTIAANKGIPMFTSEGQLTGRGAHLVKLAIDDAINPTPGTPIARNTANALRSAKADYLDWVESKVPEYKTAREVFAFQSKPVEQAQVLTAMQDVLKADLGVGERPGAFMTAMGRGEKSLLKKATGEARYSELSEVLTPTQMKVVGEVQSELMRDAKVAAQAKAGAAAMNSILEANKSKVRLPDFMSVKVTLANQMLKLMEGKLNADVMAQLEKGFQSSTSFEQLMSKVPAAQRIDVLRALGEAQGQLSRTKLNALAQAQNALSSQESQNALAP